MKRKAEAAQAAAASDDDNYQSESDTTNVEVDMSMSRKYWDHYQNVFRFCAAIRILASRSLTPNDAQRAQTFLSQATQSWAQMNCHLTPNFHTAMHIFKWVLTFGVVYAFCVFGYERFMGILSRFNTNGRSGGE